VRHVLHEADANDQVLKALDAAGLIHGCGADHQPVPLTTFRHLPPLLMLHLTRRGRLYTSR
jgi:hypothetical protein